MEPPQHHGTRTTPLFLMENSIMLGCPHRIAEWLILKGTLNIVSFQPHDRKISSPTSSLKLISWQIHCQMLSVASYYSGFQFFFPLPSIHTVYLHLATGLF